MALVGLTPAIDKKPSQLSGGMKQRVGIARAFAIQPKMLLLDEPFGALDALTRGTIQDELLAIVRETHQTVFMITHDLDSLYAITDRVAVLADKKVVAVAPVRELERSEHPWIKQYFLGPRGRAAAAAEDPP